MLLPLLRQCAGNLAERADASAALAGQIHGPVIAEGHAFALRLIELANVESLRRLQPAGREVGRTVEEHRPVGPDDRPASVGRHVRTRDLLFRESRIELANPLATMRVREGALESLMTDEVAPLLMLSIGLALRKN